MGDKSFVWPVKIRVIHWIVALAIVIDALVITDGDEVHRYAGYLAFALVVWRVWLGFFGKSHALFKNWPLSLKAFKAFAANYTNMDHVYEGHNPAASLVYLLMWICVAALALTGWMMGLDAFWGSETIEEVHEAFSNFLLLLVIAHLAGLFLDAWIHKRKTWMKMIRGRIR